MGIKQESVNLRFSWRTASKRTKAFIIFVAVFALALIRFSYQTEYIGYFAGECGQGSCRSEYTITDDELIIHSTSDDTASNVHRIIKGNFSNLKFKAPLLLISNLTGSFGCPDCADGGGYILGFKLLWMDFKFSFDKSSVPWYFNDMADIANDRIRRIDKIESGQSKN